MKRLIYGFLCTTFSVTGYAQSSTVYKDQPYWQDYSIKYYGDKTNGELRSAHADRNGTIQILTSKGEILHPHGGRFLYPGTLQSSNRYRFLSDKKLAALAEYDQQLVYLSDQNVFSNAWAGKLFSTHELPNVAFFQGGSGLTFLVSDGRALHLVSDAGVIWKGALPNDEVIGIRYQPEAGQFWVLGKKSLSTVSAKKPQLTKVLDGANFTAFDLASQGKKVIVGTTDGYLEFDVMTKKQVGEIRKKLPWTDITAVSEVDGKIWFGSTKGAFALRKDGKFDYYHGDRWLPGNEVIQIAKGPEQSVLVLTNAGLGQICFRQMTLHDKAVFYDKQVRSRHIRVGFNGLVTGMDKGNLSTGYIEDSDNDGLWTSMYLGGEIFRYAVTKDPAVLQNCRESLDAMERLYTLSPVPGFPARSFERIGLPKENPWLKSKHPDWKWKSTTSSDEVIGHIFAFGAMAELMPDKELKNRAIVLIDTLMSHIIKNDLYLVDHDGKPTLWGRWNPEYVNAFPTNVGDRKLNSSNIIAMLQTAYHFTKKEKYKKKAFELMQKHGYYANMMRTMEEIGRADDNADAHSKKMSHNWNHSDDEMYYMGYWGLYRYAFNDTLKANYKKQILDHWEAERPEKEGAWNIFTALTGTKNFDLNEAVWFLQEHPLDMIDWNIENSHRKDIEKLPDNFRSQMTKEVLPPDERPVQRHNANRFILDGQRNGRRELSAGDIWLLPYWMGRYLGVISGPVSAIQHFPILNQ